ncbi:MAG: nucleolar complex protein 14 [Candelina mexicana]|nr:MAG: nucleolar complex protein 14 [Candelina mexicana]
MPPSQLKRLKTSLRENGVVGPQRSKTKKKQRNANGGTGERVQRNAALLSIRKQFNPFEVKAPTRGSKFEYTSRNGVGGSMTKGVVGRPGVTKGLGEENRRRTLLVEMQRRHKVGGLMDRRFGEDDPTMTPEQKMLERFTREKQKRAKGSSFDLEESGEEGQLTHFGQSLGLSNGTMIIDDFDEGGSGLSDSLNPRKRRRLSMSASDDEPSSIDVAEDQPGRKKSRAEVMKEVIAKSKSHKYERQQAKENDDDLREELDRELPNVFVMIKKRQCPPDLPEEVPSTNPDRLALLNGSDRSKKDKEYDEQLRQMAFDKRAMPTERTETEEEKATAEAKRLQGLEHSRRRRMQGIESDSEEEGNPAEHSNEDLDPDDAVAFGLGPGISDYSASRQLGVEDEDDFIIDDDLIASGTDANSSADENIGDHSAEESAEEEDEEFIQDLLTKEELSKPEFRNPFSAVNSTVPLNAEIGTLAYTYSCPQTHRELLDLVHDVPIMDLPTVVQRIRATHHPKLHSENKAKLGLFSTVLVYHISYLADQSPHPPFAVLETLLRHVHSLAKTFPEEIGRAFRSQLTLFQGKRPLAPTPGDLVILTGVGTIFPTSDHFHQVVTPAILSITRYLGQKLPQTLIDLMTGAYLETLCLQYQSLSKRYVPELVNYALNALCILAPLRPNLEHLNFPYLEPSRSLRPSRAASDKARSLQFWDIEHEETSEIEDDQLKFTLLEANITVIDSMVELWAGKSASIEVFRQALTVLRHLQSDLCRSKLPSTAQAKLSQTHSKVENLIAQARLSRRPLLLHNHRTLAIKTFIPRFEESYNPDKHYDFDRERADLSKLRAEHKRERKGALRELRKDANFIARETLREKKERDAEYEKKYRRLVAEIQGEEGREANAYDRERRMRRGKK